MEQLQLIERYAQECCAACKEDPGLWNHVQQVRKFCQILAIEERADERIVDIAALLHDIGKGQGLQGSDARSLEMSKQFLEQNGIAGRELILRCIGGHNVHEPKADDPIEVLVFQCADLLATLFDDSRQAQSRRKCSKQELLALYNENFRRLRLASAQRLAIARIETLQGML